MFSKRLRCVVPAMEDVEAIAAAIGRNRLSASATLLVGVNAADNACVADRADTMADAGLTLTARLRLRDAADATTVDEASASERRRLRASAADTDEADATDCESARPRPCAIDTTVLETQAPDSG